MLIRKISRRTSCEISEQLRSLPLVGSDKLTQILVSRGVSSVDDLDYRLTNLIPPSLLKNIQPATLNLFESIKKNHSILIIGDFDADGATSTVIMMKAMKALGAKRLNFLVPDRFKFGYGLSVKLVEHAATLKPDLIITVDNGIANVDGVQRANELSIPVIITDHHLPAEKLPDAMAIVNPNQPGDPFPSKNLAGVGVAFYLMLSLRAHMRSIDWFTEQKIKEPNLAELLDIVALGTVADVVALDKNNRILVEQGLKRIRSGAACAGIKALLQIANRQENKCQATDLGFAVGPRINAAGRLDDMSVGIECLLADSLTEAMPIAMRLDQFNRSRKNIEQTMLEEADLDINDYLEDALSNKELSKSSDKATTLCLYDPNWHQGVIGILASRVKEKINRPVIIFAQDEQSDEPMIKGSARSVKGVHIRDALALVDSHNPQLIEKFGGHSMAAGLSLKQKHYLEFTGLFDKAVKLQLNGEEIKDEIITDGELLCDELTLSFAARLRRLGPWGQGFPEPVFDDEFEVIKSRLVGENHLKLVISKENIHIDGIFFRCPTHLMAKTGDRVRLVYRLDINEFRGIETEQLMIEQLEIL